MYSARSSKKSQLTSGKRFFISGFTVLELLIAIVTMSLLFTVGMAGFRGFQRRRVLEGAAVRVKSHLRLAQEMTLSGFKPATCASMSLVSIIFMRDGADSTKYLIKAQCTDGVNTNDYDVSAYSLAPEYSGVNINSTQQVLFLPLGKGVKDYREVNLFQTETG